MIILTAQESFFLQV